MPHRQNVRHRMTKDILYRNLTVALLDTLNREMSVEQVENDEVVSHSVPVYHHFGNDSNFMKDFFIDIPDDCRIPDHAEGNFEVWPKGLLKPGSVKIKTEEITNKFVRSTLRVPVTDDNERTSLKAYSAYLYAVPVEMQFELQLHGSTMNQAMQMYQGLVESFYKQFVFYFQYRGVRIPAQYQFGDEYSAEKKTEFDYTEDQKVSMNVSIQVETFHPVFDEETMMYKGNRITKFMSSANYDEEAAPGTVSTQVNADASTGDYGDPDVPGYATERDSDVSGGINIKSGPDLRDITKK